MSSVAETVLKHETVHEVADDSTCSRSSRRVPDRRTPLTSNRDSMSTELPAVMERLAKLNDMCDAKAMKCEEKSQRRAAELSGNELEEDLSILSGNALLQRLRPCIEPPSSSVKP